MRMMLSAAALVLAFACAPALAGTPKAVSSAAPVAGPVASKGVKEAPASVTAARVEEVPLSPRWIAPQWQIKGLVVWVFKPGHFQRD